MRSRRLASLLGTLVALALGGCGTGSQATGSSTSQRARTASPARAHTGTATSGSRSTLTIAKQGSGNDPAFTVIAEPAAGVAPFLKLIGAARHTIALTMYELYDTSVERALAAASGRGVKVRVLLDGGYYGEGDDDNGPACEYLRSHGVAVRYTPSYFALTHQKTLTVDGRESAIMTLNFDGDNATTRDYAVLDHRRTDVQSILAVFDADWSGHQITTPLSSDLVFSPESQYTFVDFIAEAKHSVALEAEELSYEPVIRELCSTAKHHVSVRIVMSYDSEYAGALKHLSRCGAAVRLYHGEGYFIHAKLVIVDGSQALVGSQNLTATSLEHNRELSILLYGGAPVRRLLADFDSDFAGGIPPG